LPLYAMPGAAAQVLEAQGQQVVAPAERAGLHPLVVPLARAAAPGEAEAVTGLLRWPEGSFKRVCCVPSCKTE